MKHFQKLKCEKGITLVTLVIAIIIMLIFAGITIGLSIEKKGIFSKVTEGVEIYTDIAQKEQNDLENLYSQIRIAADSKITLTTEELNQYINNKVEEKIKETTGKLRSGTVTVGSVPANSSKSVTITFKEALDTDQYAVSLTHAKSTKHFNYIGYCITDKTVNGFKISTFNNFASENSGEIVFDYIVLPFTE